MAELKKIDTPDMHIQDQKHEINTELIGIIKFRQNKKWLISIAVVSLFSLILGLMIYFMSSGVDVMGGCCLLYTSPSPRDGLLSRMPSSA